MFVFAVHDERLGWIVQSKMSASGLFQQSDGLASEYIVFILFNNYNIKSISIYNDRRVFIIISRWPARAGGTIFPNLPNFLTR